MKTEELKQVRQEIKDTKTKLEELEREEKKLLSQQDAPDVLDKYIKIEADHQEIYMKILQVDPACDSGLYVAKGPGITIYKALIGNTYHLESSKLVWLKPESEYTEISQEDWNKVLTRSLKEFNK